MDVAIGDRGDADRGRALSGAAPAPVRGVGGLFAGRDRSAVMHDDDWHTAFSGELLDLFVFAFCLWSLLEFRLDQNERRLAWLALLYGLAVLNKTLALGLMANMTQQVIIVLVPPGMSLAAGIGSGETVRMGQALLRLPETGDLPPPAGRGATVVD